jgi:CrcB protein
MVTLLQTGRLLWALSGIAVHLIGSLLMTILGMATVAWLKA